LGDQHLRRCKWVPETGMLPLSSPSDLEAAFRCHLGSATHLPPRQIRGITRIWRPTFKCNCEPQPPLPKMEKPHKGPSLPSGSGLGEETDCSSQPSGGSIAICNKLPAAPSHFG
jgi:hypothetical protein